MARDTDDIKDLNGLKDEDLPDFIFDEDLLAEWGEAEEKKSEKEENTIDLVDVVEGGRIPESVDEDTEDFEELVLDEEENGQDPFGEETEPILELEEDLKLDKGVNEFASEADIADAKVPVVEQAGEKESQDKQDAAQDIVTDMPPAGIIAEEKEDVPSISEEKIEALLTKVVSDVLERAAREVMPEVAESIISEERDVLKKIIASQD